MASRAAPVETTSKRNVIPVSLGDTEDDLSMLNDASGEDTMLEAKRSQTFQPLTSDESSNAAGSGEGADTAIESGDRDVSEEQSGFEKQAADEPEESGESVQSGNTDEGEESGEEADEEESQETS